MHNAHVPRGHHKPRKQRCVETLDLLDSRRKPLSQRQAEKKPRFYGILRELGGTREDDTRSNLHRFLVYFRGYTRRRKGRQLLTLGDELLRTYHLWQRLGRIEQAFVAVINRGKDYTEAMTKRERALAATDKALAEAIAGALKAMRYLRYGLDPEKALMLEIPYLLLRGNKATLITLTRLSVYLEVSQKYPHLWHVVEGNPAEAARDKQEALEDDPDHIFHDPETMNWKARRPIWWEMMAPEIGAFTRTIRRLAPLPKKKKRNGKPRKQPETTADHAHKATLEERKARLQSPLWTIRFVEKAKQESSPVHSLRGG